MIRAALAGAAIVVALAMVFRPPSPAAAPALTVAPASPARRRSPKPRAARPLRAIVYVAGAVRRPGLYTVTDGARAADAVRLAGGMLSHADASGVNLAARVGDGDEIDVPLLGAPRRGRSGRAPAAQRRSGKKPPAVVNVNGASAALLARVPGIGPTLAGRIVELRDRDGPYASLDGLLDVAGMSTGRLDRAAPYLRI